MKEMMLAAPVFLPLAGGAVLLAMSGRKEEKDSLAMKIVSGGFTLGVSLVIFWLLNKNPQDSLVLFRLYGSLTVKFQMDAMGSIFLGLIGFLWPLATLYAFEYMKHEKRTLAFFAYYLMTYGITAGIALAGNLVTLYLFYEMLTLVTFPLVLHSMTKEAQRASRKYLYYSISGAAFAFIGLVFLLSYSATGTTEFIAGGNLNMEAAGQQKNLLLLAYILAFWGFGVKAALFPVHGWLPKATVAPTPVTALLHAVAVVKSGAFAILRLTYFSYGTSFLKGTWAQWAVLAATIITIAFGSTMAVREIHWKRRLAYSTISNLSYILFGAALMSPLGIMASLCHLIAHAFMKICSFFCAGAVMHQTGKTFVYELDGLGKKMPVTFACLTVASLSLMGIPLFAGFISKWNLIHAALSLGTEQMEGQRMGQILPFIGAGVILYSALMTGIYMLTVLVRAYFPKEFSGGPGSNETEEKITDPGWRMLLPLIIFAAVILLMGLNSEEFLKMDTLRWIGGAIG